MYALVYLVCHHVAYTFHCCLQVPPQLMWFQDAYASAATIQCNAYTATTPAAAAKAVVQQLLRFASLAAADNAAEPVQEVCLLDCCLCIRGRSSQSQ